MKKNRKLPVSAASVPEVLADMADQGRKRRFMTLDSWNQDGNYYARYDEFGPEMEQEAPPTLNGEPL